jgi:hypothetical protein
MKKSYNVTSIKEEIAILEQQQKMQMDALKQNATHISDYLKPANLLKSTLENNIPIDSIKKIIFNNAIGLATGFITQKLLIKNKDTFSGKILSTLVNLLVANVVTHNADTLKNWGEQLIGFISKAKKHEELASEHEKDHGIAPDTLKK